MSKHKLRQHVPVHHVLAVLALWKPTYIIEQRMNSIVDHTTYSDEIVALKQHSLGETTLLHPLQKH